MNVDIFMCIYIFANFPIWAISRGLIVAFLILLPICCIIHLIFMMYTFLQTFDKHKLRENMYSTKISMITVVYMFRYYRGHGRFSV